MSDLITDLITDLKRYSPQKVILFGSRAKGEADQFSDLDILIIKKTKKRFLERLREVALLLRSTLPSVDLFVYNQEELRRMQKQENPFIVKALKEGKVIYEAKKT